MSKQVTLTIPGKLFLAGEYAVTTPGQPALIVAVDQGMQVAASAVAAESGAGTSITVQSDVFDHTLQASSDVIANWSTSEIKENSWAFVKAAVAVVRQEHAERFNSDTSIKLSISSAMKTAEGKLGLGSSAAVSVAVVSALHELLLGDQTSAETVYKEAAFAHFLVQGSGSLGDIAASTFTGLIYYQAPAWIKQVHARQLELSDFHSLDWSNLAIKPIDWPKNWELSILATREPASTKKALAKKLDRGELLPQSANAVQRAKKAFEDADYEGVRAALNKNQQALIENLPAEYLTARLSAFLGLVTDFAIAGKVSGAGFGDNGFWLTERPLSKAQEAQAAKVGLTEIKTKVFQAK